jgi:hypothetical protein
MNCASPFECTSFVRSRARCFLALTSLSDLSLGSSTSSQSHMALPAATAAATAAVATFDKTAPLAVALQKGLSEEQIVQDGWTVLMSLPHNAVNGIMAAPGKLTDADRATLAQHATRGVLDVKPSSPLSCEMWCRSLARFVTGGARRYLFSAAEVRDALLAVQPQGTTAGACQWWCLAMKNLLATNTVNQQFIGTAAVRDALVALYSQATTAAACQWWCSAICNLTRRNAVNKQIFGTAELRDALVAVHLQATTADACEWWFRAIASLSIGNAATKQLFATAEVRDALVALQPQATTVDACQWWCTAINNLVYKNDAKQRLFATVKVRNALVAVQTYAATSNAGELWCIADVRHRRCARCAARTASTRDIGRCVQVVVYRSRCACRPWCEPHAVQRPRRPRRARSPARLLSWQRACEQVVEGCGGRSSLNARSVEVA